MNETTPTEYRCSACNELFTKKKSLTRHCLFRCQVRKTTVPSTGRHSRRERKQPVTLGSAGSGYTMFVKATGYQSTAKPKKVALSASGARQLRRDRTKLVFKKNDQVWVSNGKQQNGEELWYRGFVVQVNSTTNTYTVQAKHTSKGEAAFVEHHISKNKLLSTKHYDALVKQKSVSSERSNASYGPSVDLRFHVRPDFLNKSDYARLLKHAKFIVHQTLITHPEKMSILAGMGSFNEPGQGHAPLKLNFSRPGLRTSNTPEKECNNCHRDTTTHSTPVVGKRQKTTHTSSGTIGNIFHCPTCNNDIENVADYGSKSGVSSVGEDVFHRCIRSFSDDGGVIEWLCRKVESELGLPFGTINHCAVIIYTGKKLCVRHWRDLEKCTCAGRALGDHVDVLRQGQEAKLQANNSVSLGSTVATVSVGETRVLHMKFTTTGTKEGLLDKSRSRHAEFPLTSNSLAILPSIDETILVRGGPKVQYGPHEKSTGCFMHAVPTAVDGWSVGFVFRVVHSVGQVNLLTREVILPHAQLQEYMEVDVCYGKAPHNKHDKHQTVRKEWAEIAPLYAESIEATLNGMLEAWD